jgi:predicted PurR-regulated permease PerM
VTRRHRTATFPLRTDDEPLRSQERRTGAPDRADVAQHDSGAGAERLSIDISWRSLFRIVAVAVLVWLWLLLVQLVLLVVVAVILAVALDPVVRWLERRNLSRGPAAALVGLAFTILVGAFVALAWASLSAQGHLVATHLADAGRELLARLPPAVQRVLTPSGGGGSMLPVGEKVLRSTVSAAIVVVLAFILTLYLLIEGERTYAWLVAFVPRRRRSRVDATVDEIRRVIFAYAVGNTVTSVFAAVVVFVGLTLLNVPAAFLLAVLAGICDYIPVLGFILSAVPALVLALTVSPTTALIVAAIYVAYHLCENYYVAPRVYGNQLRLSNVVVVLAFAAGAELGGVVGALIALPVAAVYPAIERIWLREQIGGDVVREHREIEHE